MCVGRFGVCLLWYAETDPYVGAYSGNANVNVKCKLVPCGGGFVNLALEKRRGFELGCMDRSVRVLINLYACVCDSSVGFWIGMSVGYDAD